MLYYQRQSNIQESIERNLYYIEKFYVITITLQFFNFQFIICGTVQINPASVTLMKDKIFLLNNIGGINLSIIVIKTDVVFKYI